MAEHGEGVAVPDDRATAKSGRVGWFACMSARPWAGIGAAILVGAVAGFCAALGLGVPAGFSQPLATLLGGLAVLGAGVLAYRTGTSNRAQTEAHHRLDARLDREHALRERYTAIAAQLADDSPAIRQAGIYALAALADDWHGFGEDDERQVCIDLLGWYLRVPLTSTTDPVADRSEREIRRTIATILTQRHGRPLEDRKCWAGATISLREVSLPGCELYGLRAPGIDLSAADLRGANLTNAELTAAMVFRAQLGEAKLDGAVLRSGRMNHAQLAGASFTGADLTGASLVEADLTGADLGAAELTDAHLHRADLTGANLRTADLTRARLTHATLRAAVLTGADLTGAQLHGADLTDAVLTGARLEGAFYDHRTRWPQGITPPPSQPQPAAEPR